MAKKNKNAPATKSSAMQEKALDLIGSRSDGLLQSELRRLLGIESSKCSRVVIKLEKAGHIRREKDPASRSFIITLKRRAARAARVAPILNIDSYLTEIYLLYLIRGSYC